MHLSGDETIRLKSREYIARPLKPWVELIGTGKRGDEQRMILMDWDRDQNEPRRVHVVMRQDVFADKRWKERL